MQPPYGAAAIAGEVVVVGCARRRWWGTARRLPIALAGLALVGMGLFGAVHYVVSYARYRGFPPPRLPEQVSVASDAHAQWRPAAQVTAATGGRPGRAGAWTPPQVVTRRREVRVLPGRLVTIHVQSPIKGIVEPVLVYLPPGYASHSRWRYPTLYLLHGFPGGPLQFIDVGDVQVDEALLLAREQVEPTVIVMPQGGSSIWDDTEWVDTAHVRWMSYVARDVVAAVDRRFRVARDRSGRAIGGLSEGGYGAMNIALHYPREFSVVESWSGYTQADTNPRYFAGSAALEAANTVTVELRRERALLSRQPIYFWFYCARDDPDFVQNTALDRTLTALAIPHHFFAASGFHDWGVWRPLVPAALEAASLHLTGLAP